MTHASRPRCLVAIAVLAILATLLAGCGGGSEPETTGSAQVRTDPPPATPTKNGKPGQSGSRQAAAPKPTTETTAKGAAKADLAPARSGRKSSSEAPLDAPSDGDRPPRTAADNDGCPAQLSVRQCREAKAAVQQGRGGSRPVPVGQCPPGLDKQTCTEIEGPASGAPPPPATAPAPSCPPALTEEQCRELEAAH